MRPTSLIPLLGLLLTLISMQAKAQIIHVNFDTAPDGSAVTNGTIVNNLYSAWGVTFQAVQSDGSPRGDTNVYASSNCLNNGPISAPNVVTLFGIDTCSDISENGLGLVQATFAAPADSVCITSKAVRPMDFGVIHAYDANGNEVATGRSSPGLSTAVICVTAPAIKRVTFSGSGDNFTWSDDLVFEIAKPLDSDNDGVPDTEDQCPGTAPGAIVDAHGCSIDQLVPCAGPLTGGSWKNHGHYVSAVAQTAETFLSAGLINSAQKDAIVSAAARSGCGQTRNRVHPHSSRPERNP